MTRTWLVKRVKKPVRKLQMMQMSVPPSATTIKEAKADKMSVGLMFFAPIPTKASNICIKPEIGIEKNQAGKKKQFHPTIYYFFSFFGFSLCLFFSPSHSHAIQVCTEFRALFLTIFLVPNMNSCPYLKVILTTVTASLRRESPNTTM